MRIGAGCDFILRRYLSAVIAALAILTMVSAPSLADYKSAKRSFENLERVERAKIMLGLIATGDFDGIGESGFTRRVYRAITAFEKREKLKADGVLESSEAALLVERYRVFADQFGVELTRNPLSGSEALVPRKAFTKTQDSAHGIDFLHNDGAIEVSLVSYLDSDLTYGELYRRYSGRRDGKTVESKTYRDSYFVVTGFDNGKHYYGYMVRTKAGSSGFVVAWRTPSAELGRKTSALMANSFTLAEANPGDPDKATPPAPPPVQAEKKRPPPPGNVTGTGFRITEAGHVLTNFHVAGQCKKIRLHRVGEVPVEASVVASDEVNDLAILKGSSILPGTVAAFSEKGAVKTGSEIAVFGFPLTGLLSDGGNFTAGNIAAMAGPGNDSRLFQITAPVQPGNSGGPVLDRKGGVVAVIVSKLNAQKIADKTGDVPQNVNFAIKSHVALGFIDGIGLQTLERNKEMPELDAPALAEKARYFTFLIECNNE